MYPIVTYQEFIEQLRDNNQLSTFPYVLVLLIKPSQLTLYNEQGYLNRIFDYYDFRTGKIQFFLPGYAHYPQSGLFIDSTPTPTPYDDSLKAFHISRLKTIYYNNRAFVDFINHLEKECPNFHYYGNTELIIVEYVFDMGALDFSNIKRYNLSALISNKNLSNVDNFIEKALELMVFESHQKSIFCKIDECYTLFLRYKNK